MSRAAVLVAIALLVGVPGGASLGLAERAESRIGTNAEVESEVLHLAEDSVLDVPLVAADVSERAKWSRPPVPEGPLPRWIRHRPVPGETIQQIAWRYGVDARHVRDWNALPSDFEPSWKQRRPKLLRVWAQRVPPARQALVHEVRAGDTWIALANAHGVDSAALRAWNVGSAGRELEPGEAVTIWIDPVVYGAIVGDSDPDSGVRAGAHGVGTPNAGTLVAGVQIPDAVARTGEEPVWELRYPNSAWGTGLRCGPWSPRSSNSPR